MSQGVEDLRETKTQLVKRQRELQDEWLDESEVANDDDMTVGELRSVVDDARELREDLMEQQRILRQAQRVDRPTLSEDQRREVLRL